MILAGMAFSVPIVVAGVLYARWIGKRIYQLPDESGEGWVRPETPRTFQEYVDEQEARDLPSLTRSLSPILIPIVLIFMNTSFTALGLEDGVFGYAQFFGNPVIAVGIGLLVAIYGLFGRVRRSDALERMEEGLRSAGIILVVTGAGGALGNVLNTSGAGAESPSGNSSRRPLFRRYFCRS
jgi:GntP family gluconate:H+ symporter